MIPHILLFASGTDSRSSSDRRSAVPMAIHDFKLGNLIANRKVGLQRILIYCHAANAS